MNTLAMIDWPQNNKINNDQWQQLNNLIEQLEPNQKLWLSGFLAASAQQAESTMFSNSSTAQSTTEKLTILYGSQTGNGESVAEQLSEQAKNAGLAVELLSLEDFSAKQLTKKQLITLVISTHGEGEAPDDAEQFYEQLFSKKAPKLDGLKYSVLALGDSSYELFCQTGKEIDDRLASLGATKIFDRVDCDVDYEQDANQWIENVLPLIQDNLEQNQQDSNNITHLPLQGHQSSVASKASPYAAEILNIQQITGRGSIKNTFHIELAIDPEKIQYQPGDSLGVLAKNHQVTVQSVLNYWQLSGDEVFEFKNIKSSIKSLLTDHIEITQISKPFVQFLATQVDNESLSQIAKSHEAFNDYCNNRQLLDLLKQFDPDRTISIQDVLSQLKAITPRLYSIASSQSAFDDEVHLTINLDEASQSGHYGLASGLICDQVSAGDLIDVYVEPNKHFKLPSDQSSPIIMIGPGTGVAPFRSFLQERKELQAPGKNWLVFGNPNFESDFLYQTEWLKAKKQGLLNKLDVAFSRDQEQKIYVQDKLLSKADEVWQWIQHGATIYLCGDANRMAKDVENILIEIISIQGKLSLDDARNHLKQLKRDHKYQKDVY